LYEWEKEGHHPQNAAELLHLIESLPENQGWDASIGQTLTASEAIALGEGIVARIMETYETVLPLWEAVIPEAVREFLKGEGSSASGRSGLKRPESVSPAIELDLSLVLDRALMAGGLYFTPWQIATFYTALQTKGFVILSGISGTGKTRLAQAFAAALPQPTTVALLGAADVTVDQKYWGRGPFAYWWSYPIRDDVASALHCPFNLYIYGDQITHVYTVTELVTRSGNEGIVSPWPDITLPDERGKTGPDSQSGWKFKTWCKVVEQKQLSKPLLLAEVRTLFGYINHPSALRNALIPIDDPLSMSSSNLLFVPVRTDWRDSKSLLGYYNPLTGTYEWTPFLRFLLRAAHSYRAGDGLAWFVLLDEMNLARVEYYFADLLSVLEAGRDAGGWTREPLRLLYPDDAEGDLPPKELRLPPNLYVIGTVNVDETTHAFSPKVLDRAFTLELTEADFDRYPAVDGAPPVELDPAARQALLAAFTAGERFVRIDKPAIAAYVADHPAVREQLRALNDLLRPYDLHFGYRVFDEIVTFLHHAGRHGLYGAHAAFDAAVLMKVLPKFHGSRGRLEAPLKAVLAWCVDPVAPAEAAVADAFREPETGDDVMQTLGNLEYRYPRTAARARRMVWALYTHGFAAFG